METSRVQGGKSPIFSVDEAREIGFKIVIYASLSLHPVVNGVTEAMETLKTTGVPQKTTSSPADAFRICGMDELMAFDKGVAAQSMS